MSLLNSPALVRHTHSRSTAPPSAAQEQRRRRRPDETAGSSTNGSGGDRGVSDRGGGSATGVGVGAINPGSASRRARAATRRRLVSLRSLFFQVTRVYSFSGCRRLAPSNEKSGRTRAGFFCFVLGAGSAQPSYPLYSTTPTFLVTKCLELSVVCVVPFFFAAAAAAAVEGLRRIPIRPCC